MPSRASPPLFLTLTWTPGVECEQTSSVDAATADVVKANCGALRGMTLMAEGQTAKVTHLVRSHPPIFASTPGARIEGAVRMTEAGGSNATAKLNQTKLAF